MHPGAGTTPAAPAPVQDVPDDVATPMHPSVEAPAAAAPSGAESIIPADVATPMHPSTDPAAPALPARDDEVPEDVATPMHPAAGLKPDEDDSDAGSAGTNPLHPTA